jgi:ribosomal protein S18 acetylase RimI-like enzyme
MARPPLRVRTAVEADLPVLLALGDELREQLLPGESGRVRGAVRTPLEVRYADALADRRRHVVVVVDGPAGEQEEVLGMALLTVAPGNALLDHLAVHMNHAVVADRHRRRGAGRALVAAAAAFAEERGVDQLVVAVHPGQREANRFFARLGFAPIAVRRTASVGAVRRKLAALEVRPTEHAVRRRRRPERLRDVLPLSSWEGGVERRAEAAPLFD